ncbi:hypothetical protein [Bifidobacterium vansinderenii]|uniref:Uncharacterized protein n=1 Tax=Bifidobacterium vansinderenii TaxID=1984871 RepID=A0A229VYC0_9BIFI|nr:hypothetical protein [Bifidobacterium vansinderenii]OXN00615.1 hypothetical protein Tam10B_1138 [Bifidobacterium vansinderenii]
MARKQVSVARQSFMNGLLADERARMERKKKEAGELFGALWEFRDSAVRLREAAAVYREHQNARRKDLEEMLDLTDVESGIVMGTTRLRENPVADDDGDGEDVRDGSPVASVAEDAGELPPALGSDAFDDKDADGAGGDGGAGSSVSFPWSSGDR